MSYDTKAVYKKFYAAYFGAANVLVWKLYFETCIVYDVLEVTGSAAIFAGILSVATIPTGIIVCAVGLSAIGFFRRMEKEQSEVSK